ncbi:STT3 domain-containing protein [Thermococcus profundus]|nr:STT3 domain-containing protein [Thermococcus profundus]
MRFKYLLGVDPYFHLTYIEEALKAGKWFNFFTIAYGPWGAQMKASSPKGLWMTPAYVYDTLKIFRISLYNAFRITPVIFGVLTIILFYLTVLKFYGERKAFFASFFLATSFGHSFRSMAGYYRGDNYMLFWYSVALLGIVYAIRMKKRLGNMRLLLYLIPALASGLASAFWQAYYPIFVFLLLNAVLFSMGAFLLNRDEYIVDGLALTIATAVGAVIANHIGEILGYGILGYKSGGGKVLTKKLSLEFGYVKDAYLLIHLKYLVPLAILAIILLIGLSHVLKDRKRRIITISVLLLVGTIVLFARFPALRDLSSGFGVVKSNPLIVETLPSDFSDLWRSYGIGILLTPLFLVRFLPSRAKPHDFMFLGLIVPSLYMLKTWTRFLFIGSMSVALMAGVGLVELYEIISKLGLKKSTALSLVFFLILPSINVYVGAKNTWEQRPMINENWEKALTWLRDNSNENDVVMAWWDRGHWVTYFTRRPPVAQAGPNVGVAKYYLGLLKENWAESSGVDYVIVSYYDLLEFGSMVYTANAKGNYGLVVIPLVSSGEKLVFQGAYEGTSYRVEVSKGKDWETTIYYQGQKFPPRGVYIEYQNETIKPEVPNPISNAYVYINLNYGYAVLMNEETLNTTLMQLWIQPKSPYKLVYSDGGMIKIFKLEHPNVAIERENGTIIFHFENATGTGLGIWGFLDNGTLVFHKWYGVKGKETFELPSEVKGIVIRYAYAEGKKIVDRGIFRRDFSP